MEIGTHKLHNWATTPVIEREHAGIAWIDGYWEFLHYDEDYEALGWYGLMEYFNTEGVLLVCTDKHCTYCGMGDEYIDATARFNDWHEHGGGCRRTVTCNNNRNSCGYILFSEAKPHNMSGGICTDCGAAN